jgi:hypothetical protein
VNVAKPVPNVTISVVATSLGLPCVCVPTNCTSLYMPFNTPFSAIICGLSCVTLTFLLLQLVERKS